MSNLTAKQILAKADYLTIAANEKTGKAGALALVPGNILDIGARTAVDVGGISFAGWDTFTETDADISLVNGNARYWVHLPIESGAELNDAQYRELCGIYDNLDEESQAVIEMHEPDAPAGELDAALAPYAAMYEYANTVLYVRVRRHCRYV